MGEGEKDYKRVELVWPGKRTQVERVKLPFQVIERVNDVRRSERGQAPLMGTEMPLAWSDNWRNKLIWGDNKYVLASLLDEFAGKVDLIYIDPPFATGADFGFSVVVGDDEIEITKEQSSIEEKAYRDTWGRGAESYLTMIHERILIMKDLLAETGSIYVHLDSRMNSFVRIILDEVFGADKFVNEIVWKRLSAHNDAIKYGPIHDTIFFYAKSDSYVWNQQFAEVSDEYVSQFFDQVDSKTGKRYARGDLTARGTRRGETGKPWRGIDPNVMGNHWKMRPTELDRLDAEGLIHWPKKDGGMPRLKRFEEDIKGVPVQDIWLDIKLMHNIGSERTGYATQKPEALLDRVITASSNEGDLVADFFCGSGTTMAVAEKLGRRWIGCDLGRFAIQTSRKRLLDMRSRPFEVLNLGRYERRYWQGITAGEAIAEYYRFIVELFHGEIIPGFMHLHGIKAGHLIHVGATDAPVTEAELRSALQECKANGFTELDVLGWEWEMGLNREGAERLARECGVKLHLFNIPREVMDKRAVEAGDVHFFEVSVADLKTHVSGREAVIELAGFLPAIDDYMRKKVGDADLKWSDWIDYWSIDFEHDGETFINQWQAYRTRKNRTLTLRSDPHQYGKPGEYSVAVKVIDIFGNDTTQQLTLQVG
jgi:adenine-specific DNA-methyltransferase